MSRGKTSHEFSGPRATERAKTILEMYESGVVDNIKIEIEESYEDAPSDDKDEDEEDTESESKDEVESEPEEGEEEAESEEEQEEKEDETERYLGEISSGTTHQKVLYAIQRLDSEAPVEASRIEEWMNSNLDGEVKRGSMFGALHDLFERRLIDREKNDEHNNEYEITVHGDDQLQKVGKP